MTDLDLKRNVESELDWEPSVNATEIGVTMGNTGRQPRRKQYEARFAQGPNARKLGA